MASSKALCTTLVSALSLAAVGYGGGDGERVASERQSARVATTPRGAFDAAGGEAWNMRLVAHHDLDGRAAYQPTIHRYGERYILFVGQHEGVHVNHLNGKSETNGTAILDVTDPAKPQYLVHIPPTGKSEEVQHAQVCDGKDLRRADPAKVYLLRTNGQESHEMWDVTNPSAPSFMRDVAVTGTPAGRGGRQTHKNLWDCRTGLGFLVSSLDGWRSPRVMQVFDLSNPAEPVHIRNFNLWENAPGVTRPEDRVGGNGVHQPLLVDNRLFVPYGMNNGGVVQILDLDRLIKGDAEVGDRFAPTRANLEYPQIARINMPTYWGGHTAKPIYGMKIPGWEDFRRNNTRDIMMLVSEETQEMCSGTNQAIFFMDITQIDRPFGISSWYVPEEPGDFCHRGGRFGPHSPQDSFNPAFLDKMVILAYFNAGVRAVDIRDPFHPREVGYYIPAVTDKTQEICDEVEGQRVCKTAIQTNNVDLDDRGYMYALDRSGTGLHILALTNEAQQIVGQPRGR